MGEAFGEKFGRFSMVVDWRGEVRFTLADVARWGRVRFFGDRNTYAVAQLRDGQAVRVKQKDLSPELRKAVKLLIADVWVGMPGGSAAYSLRWSEVAQ